jgi:hypothetical protein
MNWELTSPTRDGTNSIKIIPTFNSSRPSHLFVIQYNPGNIFRNNLLASYTIIVLGTTALFRGAVLLTSVCSLCCLCAAINAITMYD